MTEYSDRFLSLHVSILDKPYCTSERKVYGVARGEKVSVECDVTAVPPVTGFRWAFNNSGNHLDITDVQMVESSSRATYAPLTSRDYGSLLCWGINKIGKQREPCVFHIIPAGK